MPETEALLYDAFAPARRFEPSDSEVAEVLRRASARARGGAADISRGIDGRGRPRRGGVRIAAAAVATFAVIIGGAYAVPPTRAAIDDAVGGVAGVFDGWGSGEDAPGTAVRSGEPAPDYFFGEPWQDWARTHVHDPRVVAEAAGYRLFAYRESGGSIGFDLGDTGVGMGGYSPADFRRPVCVLGPGTTGDTDPDGPIPYFGVTSPQTAKVTVSYADGRIEDGAAGAGGFVVLLDRHREPTAITTLDASGDELATVPIHFEEGPQGPDAIAAPSSFC